MEAAAYFLRSQSNFFSFLDKTELSDLEGIDYSTLRSIIHNAISNTENAKTKYTELVLVSGQTLYDPVIIDRLIHFDYISFQEMNGLNTPLFTETKNYLSAGDVNGVYSRLLAETQKILEKLLIIDASLDNETLPALTDCWRLTQSYSETLLFGQYVAEVFYEITGKN